MGKEQSFCVEWLGFKPREYQTEFIERANREKRVVALWCRQTGKSTIIAALSILKAVTNENFRILIIAPTENQSIELFNKIRSFINKSNFLTKHLVMNTANEMQFTNGSRIKALPCGAEGVTIRGYTADMIILEESGYIKDKIVFEVVMPMLAATNGTLIQIGTGKLKNHFYGAVYSSKNYYVSLVHWTRAVETGQLSQEFIDEQKEELGENSIEFRTEYCCEFVDEADLYFNRELIDNAIVSDIDANFQIGNDIFYLGVDFARMGEDSSVLTILNSEGKVRQVIERKNTKLTEIVGLIKELHSKYRFKKIFLDETGMGAGPSDMLREQLGTIIYPITFTIKSKQNMYSHAKALLEKQILKLPNHKKMLSQLYDLRYQYTSNGDMKIHHSERGHDDFCDSLVLACRGIPLQRKHHFGMA